ENSIDFVTSLLPAFLFPVWLALARGFDRLGAPLKGGADAEVLRKVRLRLRRPCGLPAPMSPVLEREARRGDFRAGEAGGPRDGVFERLRGRSGVRARDA